MKPLHAAPVNSACAAIPTATVETASTTRLDDGRVALLVRTEGGPGRLLFPAAIARSLFVVTNQPAAALKPGEIKRPELCRSTPRRTHAECVALFAQIEREIAAEPRAYGATSRVLRRHGLTPSALHKWRSRELARTARESGTPPTPPLRYPIVDRAPIPKPCGALL